MSDLDRSASFWDREHATGNIRSWMEHPVVRQAIIQRIGGDQPRWPLDWLSDQCDGRVFRRALSLGCGTGAFERDMVRRGLVQSIDGLDIAAVSIATASRLASEEKMSDAIHYFVADFNDLTLASDTYDLVVFHQSLHHVDALEKLLSTVMDSLTADGVLYLDEYIGPSRTWWTPSRFASVRFVYDRLPPESRTLERLPIPVMADDPSEAIRSGEIRSRVKIGFETISSRSYGGNLLAPIFPHLSDGTPDAVISALIEEEDALLAEHGESHYEVSIARPRTGLARVRARWIYSAFAIVHEAGLARALRMLRQFVRRVWIAVDRRVRQRPIEDYT